jgi:hypothetical protein
MVQQWAANSVAGKAGMMDRTWAVLTAAQRADSRAGRRAHQRVERMAARTVASMVQQWAANSAAEKAGTRDRKWAALMAGLRAA